MIIAVFSERQSAFLKKIFLKKAKKEKTAEKPEKRHVQNLPKIRKIMHLSQEGMFSFVHIHKATGKENKYHNKTTKISQ